MSEEADINIVDEGNDSIEGYKSNNRYIDIKDIKKEQRKDKFRNIASKVSGAVRGTVSNIDRGLTNLGDRYKTYQSKAPERRQARLQKMKDRTEEYNQRYSIQKAQQRLNNSKQRISPPPSMFGGGMMSSGGSMNPKKILSFDQVAKIDPWKHPTMGGFVVPKRRTRHKRKSKSKNYVTVNGKKYYKK